MVSTEYKDKGLDALSCYLSLCGPNQSTSTLKTLPGNKHVAYIVEPILKQWQISVDDKIVDAALITGPHDGHKQICDKENQKVDSPPSGRVLVLLYSGVVQEVCLKLQKIINTYESGAVSVLDYLLRGIRTHPLLAHLFLTFSDTGVFFWNISEDYSLGEATTQISDVCSITGLSFSSVSDAQFSSSGEWISAVDECGRRIVVIRTDTYSKFLEWGFTFSSRISCIQWVGSNANTPLFSDTNFDIGHIALGVENGDLLLLAVERDRMVLQHTITCTSPGAPITCMEVSSEGKYIFALAYDTSCQVFSSSGLLPEGAFFNHLMQTAYAICRITLKGHPCLAVLYGTTENSLVVQILRIPALSKLTSLVLHTCGPFIKPPRMCWISHCNMLCVMGLPTRLIQLEGAHGTYATLRQSRTHFFLGGETFEFVNERR